MAVIYKIQSILKPHRMYVGSAVDFKLRKRRHLWALGKQRHDNDKLQRHYNKYGKDDLVFSIIATCDKEELIPLFCPKFNHKIIYIEQFFIWAYNPWFNILKIANSPLGVKRRPETCKLISKAKTGKKRPPFSEEWRKKMSNRWTGEKNPNYGGIKSEEHRKKLSIAQIEYLKTEEGQLSLQKAHINSAKTNTGRACREDTKKKIGIANKKRMKEYYKTEEGKARLEMMRVRRKEISKNKLS